MDFTNWLSQNDQVVFEAAEQAFQLHEFVRMSGNSGSALYAELTAACQEFRVELTQRGDWEDFKSLLGMSE